MHLDVGSHAWNNKLGAVYAPLPCLPPEYHPYWRIFFWYLSLFKSVVDRQEFGNRAIFSEIITELNFLESTGIDIYYIGEIKFFSLV